MLFLYFLRFQNYYYYLYNPIIIEKNCDDSISSYFYDLTYGVSQIMCRENSIIA